MHLKLLLLSAILPLLFSGLGAQTITSTSTGGNWNATATWVGGAVPSSTADVVIADGATVTLTTNQTCGSLQVGQGSSGLLEYHNGSGVTLTVNGNSTVSSGAIFRAHPSPTANRTHTLSAGGSIVNNGTITFYYLSGSYTSVVNTTLAGSTASAYSGSGAVLFNNITQANSGGFSLSGDLVMNGNLAINSSRSLDLNGYTLTIGGSYTNSGTLTANASGSTLHFNGTAAQTLTGGSYTGSYIANITSSNTHANGLTLNLNAANSIGNITVSSSAYLQVANVVLNIKGNITNNGTFFTNGGNGTTELRLNGSSQQAVSGSGSFAQVSTNAGTGRFPRLTVDNAAGVVLGQDLTIQNLLNLTAGQISGSGTLTLGIGATSTLAMTRLEGSLSVTTTYNLANVTYNATYGNSTSLPAITTGAELPATVSGVLTFRNPNGVSLGSSTSLSSGSNGLVLTANRVTLGSYDLTLGPNTTISGTPSATNMIVADGSGQLKKTYKTGATSFTFPVGDAAGHYSPAMVNLATNSVERVIGLRVTNTAHAQNGSVSDYVNRYWTFTDNEAGNGTYTISSGGLRLSYSTDSPSDVNGTTSLYRINRWDGSNWTQLNSTVSGLNVTSSANYDNVSATLGGNEYTLRNNPGNTYTWVPTSGSHSFADPASWSPPRYAPYNTDILQFTGGGTSTATAVSTQTINRVIVDNNTHISLEAATTSMLTLGAVSSVNALTVASGSHLQLAGSNAITLGFANLSLNTALAGSITVGSGNTLTFANLTAANNTLTGTLTNAGTLTATAATTKFGSGATYDHNRDGGTVPAATWDAASDVIISSPSTAPTAGLNQAFGNVSIATGAITTSLNGATTVNGELDLGSGAILSIGNNTLTLKGPVSGSGLLAGGASSVLVVNPSTAGSIGTLSFTGGAQTLSALTVNLTGSTPTLSLGSDLTVNGTLTLTAGAFSIGANTLTLRGGITATSGTFTGGTGSNITFDNSGNTTLPAVSGGLNNLTVNRSGNTITLGAPLSLAGNLSVSAGTLNDNGNQLSGNATGTLAVAAGATLSLGNGASATLFPTDYTTGNISLAATSTILYTSTSGSGVTVSSSPAAYGNLTLNGSAIKTFSGNTTVTGSFTNGSGSRPDIGVYTLTVGGHFSNSGTLTANDAASAVVLNGTAAQNVNAGTLTGSVLNKLVIANTHASGVLLTGNAGVKDLEIQASSLLNVNGRTLSVSGGYTNNGTLTASSTNSILAFNGTALQSFAIGTYTDDVLWRLTVNNSTGLTLTAPLTVGSSAAGGLTLTAGQLFTTDTSLVTVANTATGGISGGSATTYINGPVARVLPAGLSGSSVYTFPVGKGSYTPFALVNATTGASGTVTAQVFDTSAAALGATPGTGLATLNTNRYWSAVPSSAFITGGQVRLTEPAMSGANRIGQSSTASGVYTGIGGGASSPVTSSTASPDLGYFVLGNSGMLYSSATVLSPQLSTTIVAGSANEPILRIALVTTAPASPALALKSLTFNTTGTTSTGDITAAKVYYTGTSTTYGTAAPFGTTVSNPNGSHTVTGSQELAVGTNYFWLAYDIAAEAPIGNRIDAECTGLVIGGSPYPPDASHTPANTAPESDRRVDLDYCKPYLTMACKDVWNNTATISSIHITDADSNSVFSYSGTCTTRYQDLSGGNYNGPASPLEGGKTYNITVVRTGANDAQVGVWVDWNGNGQLNNAQEQILLSHQSATTYAGTFTVPSSVAQGPQRMRAGINLFPGLANSPCFSDSASLLALVSGGEFKDFTLDVEEGEELTDSSFYFRSRQSGSWTLATTWEASGDSLSWHDAVSGPGPYARSISIQAGHTVSFPASLDELELKGNLHIGGSLAYATGSNTLLVFTDSSLQHIMAADTLHLKSIQLAKAKAGAGIVLYSPVVLSDSLLLEKGRVFSADTAALVLEAGSVATGASDSSFVNGPVVKQGNTAFTFPVGKENYYRPVAISAPGEVTDVFTAEFFEDNAGLIHSHEEADPALASISRNEYWLLTRDSGSTSQVDITLSWDTLRTSCSFTEINDLRITGWDGTTWKNYGNSGSSGNLVSGSIQNDSIIEQYGYFTLANTESMFCSCNYLNVNLGPNIFINTGDTIDIGVPFQKDVTYQWESTDNWLSDSDSSFTRIRPLATRLYKLTATHATFCEKSDKITVHVLPDYGRCANNEDNEYDDTLSTILSSSCSICRFSDSEPFPDKSRKYHKLDYYIPDVDVENDFIPEKKIKINLHVLQLWGGDPADNLYFPDTPQSREYFEKVFNENSNHPRHPVKEMYLQNNAPSDPIIPSHMEIPSTRIRFELENVYFHQVGHLWFYRDYRSGFYRNLLLSNIIDSIGHSVGNNLNYFLVNKVDTVAGIAVLPNCNYLVGLHHVFSVGWYDSYLKNNFDDSWTHQRHAGHELAHNVGLNHTYNLCSSSSSSFNYLGDLFSNGDLTPWNRPHPCPHPTTNHAKLDVNGDTIRINGEIQWWGPYDNDPTIVPNERNTTNNIMGGQFVNYNFTPKQIGVIHRSLSLTSMRKYVADCPYSSRPIEVDSNETWAMDFRVYNDIIVKSGNTLTVKCKIHFPDQASLIVEPGATLVVDGGLLTGACTMWKGIRLMGDVNAPQGDTLSSPQGVVRLYNATIENADEGIFMGYGPDYLNHAGGIVRAYSSTFRNNWRSVCFNPYDKYISSSLFKECTFICDGPLKKPLYQSSKEGSHAFVTIWGARGVQFIDNTFENTITYTLPHPTTGEPEEHTFPWYKRGHGIISYDGQYTLLGSDPGAGKRNKFVNLRAGIHARKAVGALRHHVKSTGTLFENVFMGVYSENSSADEFRENTFKIPAHSSPSPYGMYQFHHRNFKLIDNTFEYLSSPGGLNWGLATGGVSNELVARYNSATVEGNTFNGLYRSYQNDGHNPHIRLSCNQFGNSPYEWLVNRVLPGGLFASQGIGCHPVNETRAGNKFLDAGQHIWSQAGNQWIYHARTESNEVPNFATPVEFGERNACGTGLPDPCTTAPPPPGGSLHARVHARRQTIGAIGSARLGMIASLDQGNTASLAAGIADLYYNTDSLTNHLKASSPLSDTVLSLFLRRDSILSNNQFIGVMVRNTPLGDTLVPRLKSLLNKKKYPVQTNDSLYALQAYNPHYTTVTALERELQWETGAMLRTLGLLEDSLLQEEDYSGLIGLYKDTLDAPTGRPRLLALYTGLDSIAAARSLLDSLPLVTHEDSVYVSWYGLALDLKEDSLTWMDLDSVQLAFVETLAIDAGEAGDYARSVLALRGDTSLLHRFPDVNDPPPARLGYEEPERSTVKQLPPPVMKLYPNPSPGLFVLEYTGPETGLRLEITDMTGRMVHVQPLKDMPGGRLKSTIDLSGRAQGIYLCRLMKDNTPVGSSKLSLMP